MKIRVDYIFNHTKNTTIEYGSQIMYFDDYEYEDLEDGTLKESELIDLIIEALKRQFGYYSIKVTSISEV